MTTTTSTRTGSTGTRRIRTTAPRGGTHWKLWSCPNCRGETREPRKRCADCGTSRY